MVASSSAAAETSCGHSNQCHKIDLLPINHGLMITLDNGIPFPTSSATNTNAMRNHDMGNAVTPNTNATTSNSHGTCLKLHPQEDANLPQFHPNIYIPNSLLDYPDQLVKYGGGGSGVTVFGGHHPLLGNLVMKHGGHKDLVELVSLAKIEREMGVRGKWKMDRLLADDEHAEENGNAAAAVKMSQTDHVVVDTSNADHSAVAGDTKSDADDDGSPNEKRKGLFQLPVVDPTVITQVPTDVMKKIKSQTVFQTVESMMGKISHATSMDRLGATDKRTMKNKAVGTNSGSVSYAAAGNFERELQIQAIQHAMEDMKSRIPAFRMIYISPMHLRERKEELQNNTFRSSRGVSLNGADDALHEVREAEEEKEKHTRISLDSQVPFKEEMSNIPTNNGQAKLIRRLSSVMRKGRQIHLFGSENTKASSIYVRSDSVDLCFGGNYRLHDGLDEEKTTSDDDIVHAQQRHSSDGYASLIAFVNHLQREQEKNDWKITLAQQTIGRHVRDGESRSAMTASSLLARGELHGPLLHHLIDSEIQVIRNLQLLTMPEEVDVADEVRAEYERIVSCQKDGGPKMSAERVSKCANHFVGKAIHKNFHPTKGRFVMIRKFGVDLRRGEIHLKPKEVVPAKHLETLFYQAWERADVDVDGRNQQCKGAHSVRAMEETFNMFHTDSDNGNDSSDRNEQHHHPHHPMFVMGMDQWQSLLELSLSIEHPNATNRIWTCGLTDGGLHNMFLSESKMWLFDLGEPNLEPIPAFLTKFLMSFFHTLGMEEDAEGDWVVRFEQDDASGKLRLTERTKELLPRVMEAFNITMDRIIDELFDGEERIRVLLLRYVVTQLISDAAFCIEKWRIKGGGDEQRSEHQYFLEKWLWRALWDVYASEEIRRRYLTRTIFRKQQECRDLGPLGLSLLDSLKE